MKQRRFLIRLVWAAIGVGGLAVLLIYCAFSPGPAISSSEVSARLEAAWLLYEQVAVFPVGPVVVALTPFQMVYVVVSIVLLFIGLVVCLARCLIVRYAQRFNLPPDPARNSDCLSPFRWINW